MCGTSNGFIIRIENQRWLDEDQNDLCSDGEVYLKGKDNIITQQGNDEDLFKTFWSEFDQLLESPTEIYDYPFIFLDMICFIS